jgi:ribosomal protein S25
MVTVNQAFAQTHAVNPFHLRVLDTSLAAALGVNEAIFLDRLQFWLSKGYGILYKGKRWIYNTYQQWITKELPWLSYDQFKRMIKRLLNLGVLMIEKLKAHEWKQTNFYTINEEALKAKITMPTASGGCADSNSASSPDDLCTDQTSEKTERENDSKFKSQLEEDPWAKEENGDVLLHKSEKVNAVAHEPEESVVGENDRESSPDSGIDESSEAIETNSQLQKFHKDLAQILQFDNQILDPWAYAQKVVDQLRAGSPSSRHLFNEWQNTGTIEWRSDNKTHGPTQDRERSSRPNKPINKSNELKEWHIKPEDRELLEQGHNVGDIYPQFVQWATPRLKHHPDLSDHAARVHAIKTLKLEPQVALTEWRDFKRLLVQEVKDKQDQEAKGQRYVTPSWMQQQVDIPVSEARKASMELNEAKYDEQQSIEATRSQKPILTGGENKKAIESSESEAESKVETSEEPKAEASNEPKVKGSEEPKPEASESWYETISKMVPDGNQKTFSWLVVRAINDALREVDEEEKMDILQLARDSLSNDALNQIKLEF